MKFEMRILKGVNVEAVIVGGEVKKEAISMEDVEKVIETEQYLERLFGLRFHISTLE